MTRQAWIKTGLAAVLTAGLAAAMLQPRPINAAQPGADGLFEAFALPSGGEEAPNPVDTPATGFARFVMSEDRKQLFYEVKVSGLTGDATAMHLHAAPRGKAGGVVVALTAPAKGRAIGCVDMPVGVGDALASQGLYLNIHTAANKGGEVRGQVVPAP